MASILMIDDREITQHHGLLESFKIPVDVRRLEAADYCFLDRNNELTGIERCEIGNLIQKIRSGELESQLVKCDDNYSRIILLTEGVFDHVGGFLSHYKKSREGNSYYRVRIEPSFRYAEVKALEIRLSELGIETMWSPNFDCTVNLIETIYQQRTKPEEAHTLFRKIRQVRIPVKFSSNPAVPKLLALCSRLPEKVAIKLINQYGSIWSILHADEQELLQVGGLGKGLIRNLKQSIGKPE